ncbi:MAG: GIY-YIG nuclease family protein [Gordonia sp. (in: high G+C Gram-positive bacteria)]|uniref:GIY-YIG nuclease family protein n=1 Tax=Gordonia sp. (in: high G+C Gram-positive bacteria) TaxID=84139 RepID=UPI0039E31466
MPAHLYILKCCDGSFYVGSTRNLEQRLYQHRTGVGAVYTAKRLPVELVYCAEFDSVADAFAMEKRVQGWSRAKRTALIDGRADLLPLLSRRGRKASEPLPGAPDD